MSSMEIIGKCPYCERQVTKDLRPVNAIEGQVSQRIGCILKDTDLVDQSVPGMTVTGKGHKSTQYEENVCVNNISSTKTILDLVESQMDNKEPNYDEEYLQYAEAVVALLHEEDYLMQKFEDQAVARQAAEAKRRRL